ncbi:hypothetical protein NG895_15955 [Aeoliella sp. ICT_H6.2]|uniref:Alpha/beta hydrolase n=1 Tax=Aeoliella straminimaris TaxID=2954799 RepID=A0A9X2JJU2_9BACT|nr:hypothetical protein [Aeoliella straminimaris]MCO6045404.1 hypothetical protein [Aeoliella straminimaris]
MRALFTFVSLASLLVGISAHAAELPNATGQQFTLENKAAKLFVPAGYQMPEDGGVDLLIHFHGDPPTVWKNAEYAKLNVVILTVNYNGLSRAYSVPASNPKLFPALLDESLAVLKRQEGFPADTHWRRVGVSSFSAGYGAVREILQQPGGAERIDCLLAADSLYASTAEDSTPEDAQMAPFIAYAKQAAAGDKTFVFSYSRVPTDGYETTKECIDEILAKVDLQLEPTDRQGLGELVFNETASRGKLHVWGTPGDDGQAHMAHLRYVGEFFKQLPLAKREKDER